MSAARLHKRAVKKAAKKTAAKKAAAKVRAYRHQEKRTNIPHAGIAHKNPQTATAVASANDALTVAQPSQYDHHLHPQLLWAGRQEQPAANVPIQPLHVHERVDPAVIIRATLRKNGNGQPPLFESPDEKLTLKQELEFYQHERNWSNRLIAGDSLIIMNSLLQKEAMEKKVQCVYMDPPYGIKYGSNFQPFINSREVKDKKDKDLTTEPVMIRAFRDTWKYGIHSYLSYLRDRLALCRELLADSGSCFVQISDENVHLVRNIMDEIFGPKNFVSMITFRKKNMPLGGKTLENMCDYLLWYAKDKPQVKYRHLWGNLKVDFSIWKYVEFPDGTRERLTRSARRGEEEMPKGARVYRTVSQMAPSFSESNVYAFEFEGREFMPTAGMCWVTSKEKMELLAKQRRLQVVGNLPEYILYADDFPYSKITNPWMDTGGAASKIYAVQTAPLPITRCLLMTTDPGDLVLDPTCGSGTTAYVAEQWGRRWITCDTSRVALTLARQRLMTARFNYYKMQDDKAGVQSGFVCKTVPHIMLKSIANNLPPEKEVLHDQPDVDRTKARVTGPFTVEAVPSPVVKSPEDVSGEECSGKSELPPGSEESRQGETHRQALWRVRFEKTGLRLEGGRRLEVQNVRLFSSGASDLHATFTTREEKPQSGFVSFGPEHAPLGTHQVRRALDDMEKQRPRRSLMVFAAFEFDPEAARTLDETEWEGVAVLKVLMNSDLQTKDLRNDKSDGDSFWLIGRPDAELRCVESGEDAGKWVVLVRGFDYYDPVSGEMRSGESEDIAMWMLDPDYDGASVYPRQVFFPLSEGRAMWQKLARSLRAEVDEELMEKFTGRESLPFEMDPEGSGRVAVKIVDKRGVESLRILRAKQ